MKNAVNEIEKGTAIVMPQTPSLDLKSLKEDRLITLRTLHRQRQEMKETIKPIENSESSDNKNITQTSQQPLRGELVETSGVVQSVSMNIVDDSIEHLHGLMKGKVSNVQEACLCANQITKLIRLKFDIVKHK